MGTEAVIAAVHLHFWLGDEMMDGFATKPVVVVMVEELFGLRSARTVMRMLYDPKAAMHRDAGISVELERVGAECYSLSSESRQAARSEMAATGFVCPPYLS